MWGWRRRARGFAGALAGLSLFVGAGLVSAPAAGAVDADLLVPLPTAPIEPYLVAASGDSLVDFQSLNDQDTVAVSNDRGAHWTEVSAPLNRADYVADGTVRYHVDGDGTVSLYSWDLASGTSSGPVVFPTDRIVAVGSEYAVYGTNATEDEEATEFAAAPVGDPSLASTIVVPSRERNRLRLLAGEGTLGVAVSTGRDSRQRATTGYLDVVQLTGGEAGYPAASVPGLVSAEIRGDVVSYLTADSAGVRACRRSLASPEAWQVVSCLQAVAGDYRTLAEGTLVAGPDWAAFSVVYGDDSYAGAYLADWSTSTPKSVKLKASGAVKQVLLQRPLSDLDRPLVAAYTTYSADTMVGYLAKVGADGSLTRFAEWPSGTVSPTQLSLSATRVAGADARGSGTAWRRELADPGVDDAVWTTARSAHVSAGWTAVNAARGLALLNHNKQVAKLAGWAGVQQLSGPYLLGKAKSKDTKLTVLAAGKKIAFRKYDYPSSIFGSLVAVVDTWGWNVIVYNVASGKPVQAMSLPLDDNYESADVTLWGDDIVVTGWLADGGTEVRALEWIDGNELGRLSFSDAAQAFGASDGAVLLWHEDGSIQVLNLTTMQVEDLAGNSGAAVPVFDDAARVLYATDTRLVVHQVSDAGRSAPRALWSSAPRTFNSFGGPTSPFVVSVDATRAMSGGSLVIQKDGPGDSPKVTIPVEASPSGSLRIAWNGEISDGTPAAPGTWAWHLEGFDELRALDLAAYVSGTVTISNRRVALAQAAPTIDVASPVTDTTLTATPGTQPDGAVPAYQWYRDSKAIKGARAQAYTVQPADVGHKVKVKVSFPASLRYLASSKYSRSTARVGRAALTKGGAVLGADAPQVDVPFAVAADGWGPDPVKLAYQWYRVDQKGSSKAIPRATAAAYRPSGSVVGLRLKVVLTVTRPGYTSVSVSSATSAAVLAGSYQTVPTPVVTGAPEVGHTLGADAGTYRDAAGEPVQPSLAYQWYRVTDAGDVPIAGATRATYRVASADLGHALKVKVTATRSGYPTQTTLSDPTDLVVQGD